MRLNKFESAGIKPIGEGEEKRVFINPDNEKRIVYEIKEGKEKDTHRQLKGRYYLTKIAHLLLPENIPDIYEAGESPDGTQIVDAERISHTPGHKLLQEKRQSGEDEELARQKIIGEMGVEMNEATNAIADIGLAFNIDENVGNYTKDEKGNVNYLETFKPWETNPTNLDEIELLFNEEELKGAIDGIPDHAIKEKCARYLDRLLVLFEEEKQELKENREASLVESGPHIEALEAILAPFLKEDVLAELNALKTEEEARSNEKRKSAMKILTSAFEKLNFLMDKTNITDEEYNDLYKKYKILFRATGAVNRGMVDHDR